MTHYCHYSLINDGFLGLILKSVFGSLKTWLIVILLNNFDTNSLVWGG